jgi:hypothetical protein
MGDYLDTHRDTQVEGKKILHDEMEQWVESAIEVMLVWQSTAGHLHLGGLYTYPAR